MKKHIVLIHTAISNIFNDFPAVVLSIHEARPPLGLGSIAALLKKNGFSVTIYDQLLNKIPDKELAQTVALCNPLLVGFSCTSLNIHRAVDLAKAIKMELPDTIIIAGGIHPTLKPSKTLSFGAFDAIVCGEGEQAVVSIADWVCKGRDIHSFSYHGVYSQKKVPIPPTRMAVLKHLNGHWPCRETLKINEYSNCGSLVEDVPCHSIFQSRGCPWTCRFCAKPSFHKEYRFRDLTSVVDEMEYLVQKHGAKAICFREDNFTADPQRLIKLTLFIKERFGDKLPWECESRADINIHMLNNMVEAGCKGIWCGIESSVPKWQKYLGKRLAIEKIQPFYQACLERGIATGALFMFGFPGQTNDELNSDINYSSTLPVKWRYFQLLGIMPGNTLYPDLINDNHLHWITNDVALSVYPGHTVYDMIALERQINKRINVTNQHE